MKLSHFLVIICIQAKKKSIVLQTSYFCSQNLFQISFSDTQVKTWYQNRRTKWKRTTSVGLELLAETGNYAALQSLYRGVSPYALAGLSSVPSYGAAAAAAAAAAANGPLFGCGGAVGGPAENVSTAPPILASPHTITTTAIQSQTLPSSCSSNHVQISPALEMYYRQVQAMNSLHKEQPNENSDQISRTFPLKAPELGNISLVAQKTATETLLLSVPTTTSHVQSNFTIESPKDVTDESVSSLRTCVEESKEIKDEDMLHSSLKTGIGVKLETQRSNSQFPLKPTPIVGSNSSEKS